MLIDAATLKRITAGEVTAALRRWRRPTVKAGGTLKTRDGVVLAIDAVDVIDAITPEDAAAAGFPDVAAAVAATSGREGELVRVRFHVGGADPRLALRDDVPDAAGLAALAARLRKLDRTEPWTRVTLDAIAAWPGRSARDIAPELGFVRKPWKVKVRSLKALGLTVSLPVGYHLSDRGVALWGWLRANTPGVHVRPAAPADADPIRGVVTSAFDRPDETALVDALRADDALRIELVAEEGGAIVGHVALSPITVDGAPAGLGLAPVSVRPDRQRRGIGDALVREALLRADRTGHPLVVVLGDPAYYARFGFAATPALTCPIPAPPGAFQARGTGAGVVRYHPALTP